ncbi:MAG: transposase [Planctomycetes bacterium B3_Pla]|nr:MAG: transposase [Planctomycetes bacterium B3_Pla]
MSYYRRARFCGGYYFFTVVTYKRRKILTGDLARKHLRKAFEKIRSRRYFKTIAFCLLPEHLHCIWQLPPDDGDFSTRWSLVKRDFTMNFLKEGGDEFAQSTSRLKHRHRGVWQKRFWEHQIRDERDLQNHIDYIHYNPVKHGLAKNVDQWSWSTYHKYVESGRYGKVDLEEMQERIGDVFVGE